MKSILSPVYKLIVFFAVLSVLWAKTVQLDADEVRDMGHGDVMALGHVTVAIDGVTINAKSLKFSKKKQLIISTGSVSIRSGDQLWQGRDASFWVSPSRMVMYQFSTTASMFSQDKTLYISANVVEKISENYQGERVQWTTCPHNPPHYTFEAQHFELVPNDQIVGHEVTMKVGGIPVLYCPYYALVQGYKRWVILMPIVGASYSEGAYMKETFLYDWNENLRTRTYLDVTEKKGIGLGEKVSYGGAGARPGAVYGYYLGSDDHALGWSQWFIENQRNTWGWSLSDRHMTAPNGFREDETKLNISRKFDKNIASILLRDQQGAFQQSQFEYSDSRPEETQDWSIDVTQYPRSSFQSQSVRQRIVRRDAEELMTWRNVQFGGTQQQFWQDKGTFHVDSLSIFTWDLLYKRQLLAIGDESTLLPRMTYSVTPTRDSHIEQWGVKMNTEVDLDSNRVTWDEQTDIVEVMPELFLKSRPHPLAGGMWQVGMDVANIRERHFTGQVWTQQTQKLGVHNAWSSGLYSGIYDQYFYGTGDKQYVLAHQVMLELGAKNGLNSSWMYRLQTRGGYTPFFFDDVRTSEERLTHQLRWPIDSNLLLTLDDGYNVREAHFEDERVSAKWTAGVSSVTQIMWTRDPQSGQGRSLQASTMWQEGQGRSFSVVVDHDLVSGRTRAGWLRGAWRTQEREPVVVDLMVRWNAQQQTIIADQIRIARNLDCMEYAYEWVGARFEHRFVIKIDGIPDGSMGVTAGDNGLNVWGLGEQDAMR